MRIPGVYTVSPHDGDYTAARRMRNLALDFRPAVIAYPYDEREVCYAIRFAAENDLAISVRSGGHDYEGFSSNDGGLVVDTSRIDGVALAGHGHRCTVGPGATLRKLYHTLFNDAGATLPGGTCGSVAVAGLTLGGGIGHLSRRFGLLCDRLRRIRLIDAAGNIRDSRTDKAADDLLWSARGGGGGNFGVVSELEFEMVPIPGKVVAYSYKWAWDHALVGHVLEAFGGWVHDASRSISASLVVTGGPQNVVHLFGQSLLSADATAHEMDPLIRALPAPAEPPIVEMPYLDAVEHFADGEAALAPWKMTSSFISGPLTTGAIGALTDSLSKPPIASALVQIDALGGAVSDIGAQSTAYAHRSMSMIVQYQAYWSRPDEAPAAHAWIDEIFRAVDPHTSRASYRNYSDASLNNWAARYYGANYARLQKIKKRLDPHNRFRYPQSVRAAD